MGNQIIKTNEGKYRVRVQVQDGTEDCGLFHECWEAVVAYTESQRALNGNKNPVIPAITYEKSDDFVTTAKMVRDWCNQYAPSFAPLRELSNILERHCK